MCEWDEAAMKGIAWWPPRFGMAAFHLHLVSQIHSLTPISASSQWNEESEPECVYVCLCVCVCVRWRVIVRILSRGGILLSSLLRRPHTHTLAHKRRLNLFWHVSTERMPDVLLTDSKIQSHNGINFAFREEKGKRGHRLENSWGFRCQTWREPRQQGGVMCGSECFARLILLSFKEFNQLAPPCSPCTTKHPTWTHINKIINPDLTGMPPALSGTGAHYYYSPFVLKCPLLSPVFESSWSLKCARPTQVSTTDSRFKIWQKQEVTDANRPLKSEMK